MKNPSKNKYLDNLRHGGKDEANCFRCLHFYITYEPAFPYGCHVMGFKSKQLPSTLTRRASGTECLSFEEAPRNAR